jgi:serine/threonine protein kinase
MFNNKTGGKLLDEGGYGCVYHPSINCDGNESNNMKYISKISVENEDILREIKISKLIKSIPNYNYFFAPIETSCPISINKISNDIVGNCTIIKEKKKLGISKFLVNDVLFVKGDKLSEFLEKKHKSPNFAKTYYRIFLHLIEAINLLQKYNLVHYDIKPANIMIDENTEKPLLIDFGITIPINENDIKSNYNSFFVYAPDYYFWSLHTIIISWILESPNKLKSVISKQDLKNIIDNYFKANKIFDENQKLFSKNFFIRYKEIVKNHFIKTCSNITGNECINILLKSWREWDYYSLAQLFLVYNQQYKDYFINLNDHKIFIEILLACINPIKKHQYSYEGIVNGMQKII